MNRSRRLARVALLAFGPLALALGCAGPRFPAPIEGIPTCADFTLGKATMLGGLRFPVRLRVLDGKTVVFQTVITGMRSPADTTPSTYIADANATYTAEWAQCGNERAPRPVAGVEKDGKGRDREGTAYQCGEAKPYQTAPFETKKGDRASHVLHFPPPPNAVCWAPEPAAPATTAVADAGVGDDAGSSDAGSSDAGMDAGTTKPAP